ncbi:MAG: hypothetical protein KHZ55_02905 [Clostridium celatum]|nr:hypothetical protein [Clostridium celatum]
MGIGTEVFTMPGSKFKAICLNPVEDLEKIKEISQRYYEGLVNALEITFGENWATEVFKQRGWTQKDFIKVGDKYELRQKNDKDCSNK